jgi:hypothetical protein
MTVSARWRVLRCTTPIPSAAATLKTIAPNTGLTLKK